MEMPWEKDKDLYLDVTNGRLLKLSISTPRGNYSPNDIFESVRNYLNEHRDELAGSIALLAGLMLRSDNPNILDWVLGYLVGRKIALLEKKDSMDKLSADIKRILSKNKVPAGVIEKVIARLNKSRGPDIRYTIESEDVPLDISIEEIEEELRRRLMGSL